MAIAMSEEEVVQKEKRGRLQKFRDMFSSKTPSTTIEESKRFSRLGYLQYPKRHQLDIRLFKLMDILEEIEKDMKDIDKKTLEDLEPYAYRNIKKLFRAFMTIGAPWFRGLDDRELAKKAVAFFELETMIGHLPAFYPDLKLCTETLINLSWKSLDVTAETPVLFETRTTVVPPDHRAQSLSGGKKEEY